MNTKPKFSEKLIGEWHWFERDENRKDSIVSNQKTESVQEVMRSCGGAVQGIREIPSGIPSSSSSSSSSSSGPAATDEKEGYYLNRANDGITYFDKDGSYSCGPVQLEPNDGTGDTTWISSLAFGKARLILARNEAHRQQLTVFRKSALEESLASSENDKNILPSIPENIVWMEVVRCRMPSITQPWMTQRLKWERFVNTKEVKSSTDETIESSTTIDSWLLEGRASELPSLEAACAMESSNLLWSAGGICTKTGILKSITREYSSMDGSLKSIAWLQGSIPSSESKAN